MIRNHNGDIRGFTQLSKAWYGKANLTTDDTLDRLNLGLYCPDGGTSGEFEIKWVGIGRGWTPILNAFDDGWSALYKFKDLLKIMASIDSDDITPDDFVKLLEKLGIKNMTQVEVK